MRQGGGPAARGRRVVRDGGAALRDDRGGGRAGRRGHHHAVLLRRHRPTASCSWAPRRSSSDIDPKTLNLDVAKVAAAITPRTKAIVAVEAFGHPGGMIETGAARPAARTDADRGLLRRVRRAVAAAAAGGKPRPIGRSAFGRAGVFGFYPNKQITTGEGGMIVTDDDAFAAICRSLRNQGRDGMSWLAHQRLGYNYRLSEINAALGVVQMSAAGGDPGQPPPRRPRLHGAADDQPLPHPPDASTTRPHELVRLRRPAQRPVRRRRPRRGHAANCGPRASAATITSPRSTSSRTWPKNSGTSRAISPSPNTSPPARWPSLLQPDDRSPDRPRVRRAGAVLEKTLVERRGRFDSPARLGDCATERAARRSVLAR